MKTVNSFALASMSFVAVSGSWADEPLPVQPQQQPQKQAVSPPLQQSSAQYHRLQRLSQNSKHDRVILLSASAQQPQSQSPAASQSQQLDQKRLAAASDLLLQNAAPRRSLLSRLLGKRSRNTIPISQATAPAADNKQVQPLPNTK